MKFVDLNKKSWQWIVLLALAFIWGSSFILMKKGLRSFDYMQVAALRVFFSFIILSPVFLKNIRKVNRKNVVHLIISGYAGVFFPAFLFTKAQTNISSSLAGMINSLAPFFALIIGILLYRNKPKVVQYIGIGLGLVGAVGLLSNGNILESINNINGYALYVVVATLGYGINANEVKFKLKGLTGVEVTSLSFMMIGIPAGIYLLMSDYSAVVATPDWPINLMFIFILALFGSVISLFFFNELIQKTSALFATSVTYIIPFFAILWGVFDGETITVIQILSISLALVGVWLVNKRKKQQLKGE
ncbi:MAG: DMT family transporter [Bacteroidales bacterium]|jgi:drug/metabolite transporter (DMT)-like permease|nr:DMT family transporter [Bacteroidales bacterium]